MNDNKYKIYFVSLDNGITMTPKRRKLNQLLICFVSSNFIISCFSKQLLNIIHCQELPDKFLAFLSLPLIKSNHFKNCCSEAYIAIFLISNVRT